MPWIFGHEEVGMEKLSYEMEGGISREGEGTNHGVRGSGGQQTLALACILWYAHIRIYVICQQLS